MACETSAYNQLECMLLDESLDATNLPISLLESITNNFSNDQQIGEGGFATVYKGILQNGAVAVKKLFNARTMGDDKFIKEVVCLMRVKHKNIVRFLGYCADAQGKMLNYEGEMVIADERQRLLCFEFVPGGNLDSYIHNASGGLQWWTCYKIIKGICEGLHYLHQKNIVHLDLKPANILLDQSMVPKIADFGISKCFDGKQTRAITSNMIGSLGYMAPESYDGVITLKSDIYSLGIIILEMLTGQKGCADIDNVLESWSIRFKTSQGDISLEPAVRVCAEIGIECTNFNRAKRPPTQCIIERLDEMERAYSFVTAGSSNCAATKLQQVYRSFRARRMLADSTIVAEELWWQALEFSQLNRSAVSFSELKPETSASHWNQVGQGLSRYGKAQKLALQHWIEAIDPRHRYGHNLHFYYDVWCKSQSGQPFFYWLDIGEGKDVDLPECPRALLRKQCIKYLGPKERENYEYIINEGKIVHKLSGELLDTSWVKGFKWIFVVSTTKRLYAGKKEKGVFQHSSFLAGGATIAAGRFTAEGGVIKSICASSSHYTPSSENLSNFMKFLEDKGVDLKGVEIVEDITTHEAFNNPCTAANSKRYGPVLSERCSSEIGVDYNLQDKKGQREDNQSIMSLKNFILEQFKRLHNHMDAYEVNQIVEDIKTHKAFINPCTDANNKTSCALLYEKCCSEIGADCDLQDEKGQREDNQSIMSLKKFILEEFERVHDRMDAYEVSRVSMFKFNNDKS